MNGIQTEESERPDVEAPQRCPCLPACASLWRQPSLFGDDTHAVVARPKWAWRARNTHETWSNASAEVNVTPRCGEGVALAAPKCIGFMQEEAHELELCVEHG